MPYGAARDFARPPHFKCGRRELDYPQKLDALIVIP